MFIRKASKILLMVMAVVAALIFSLQVYLNIKATKLFAEAVDRLSNGMYKGKATRIRVQVLSLRMRATNLEIVPADSVHAGTYYIVRCDSLYGDLGSVLALIFQKHLEIEKVHLVRPVVEVYDHELPNKEDTPAATPLRLVILDMQRAMMRSFNAFNVDEFALYDARFRYYSNPARSEYYNISNINLSVKNLINSKQTQGQVKADINVSITDPALHYPDSLIRVSIDRLELSTVKNSFSVQSLELSKRIPGTDSAEILAQLSAMQLAGLNWINWLQTGLVEIDSVSASNGHLAFDFTRHKTGSGLALPDSALNLDGSPLISMLSPLLVHQVRVSKLTFVNRRNGKHGPLTVSLLGDSLGIKDLEIMDSLPNNIAFADMLINVKNYSNSDDQSTYEATFGGLKIGQEFLELTDLKLHTLNVNAMALKYDLSIPQLTLVGLNLLQVLNGKLSADKLSLNQPQVYIGLPAIKGNSKKTDIEAITEDASHFLDLNLIEISDGLVAIKRAGSRRSLVLNSINALVDVPQLLLSKQATDLVYATNRLNASDIVIDGDNMHIQLQQPQIGEDFSEIKVDRAVGKIAGSIVRFDVRQVHIIPGEGLFKSKQITEILLPQVSIGNGDVFIDLPGKSKKKSSNKRPHALNIAKLDASKLRVQLKAGRTFVNMPSVTMHADNLQFKSANAKWDKLDIKASRIDIQNDSLQVDAEKMHVQQPGFIIVNGVRVASKSLVKKFQLDMGAIKAVSYYNSTDEIKRNHLQAIQADHLVFNGVFNKTNEGQQVSGRSLPDLLVDSIIINDASVRFENINNDRSNHFSSNIQRMIINRFEASKSTSLMYIDRFWSHIDKPLFWQRRGTPFTASNSKMIAHDMIIDPFGKKISAMVDSTLVENLSIHQPLKKDTLDVNAHEVGFADYAFNSQDSITKFSLLKHKNWWIKELDIRKSGEIGISVHHLKLNNNDRVASWDSLSAYSSLSRDSFWRLYPYEKAYLTLKMGQGHFRDYKVIWEPSAEKPEVYVHHVEVNDVFFKAEKDKTGLPDTVSYRPLLARSLAGIPFRLLIDTILLNRGQVRYNEIAQKTKTEAYIYFTDVKGRITNIKNYDYAINDSIRARLTGKLMGQGAFLFNFRQSYTDTLQGFYLTYQMSKFNMPDLNVFLKPVVSLQISHGYSDSTWMRVKANEYAAYGLMDFRYRNLKLAYLKNGGQEYFLSGFINGIINAFVRTNSNNKRDIIYQQRLRNKAIYGYWGRIAISGLLTNLGVKRDKKQKRLYEKSAKELKLPDYTEDF